MEEDNSRPGAGTILIVMVTLVIVVLAASASMKNSYRGTTPAEECERTSCAPGFGCNNALYRMCLKEVQPVFRCLKGEINNPGCWSLYGTTTKTGG